MKIRVVAISKEDNLPANELCLEYAKRIKHYTDFSLLTIKPLSAATEQEQKEKEASAVLKTISPNETLILLDERGKQMDSSAFAAFIQQKMNTSTKTLSFLIGGAFGFHESVYEKSHDMIALSKMTFPHQLAKVILLEQLYRSFTIMKNEKYHHGKR